MPRITTRSHNRQSDQTVAIVTTLRHPGPSLPSFITYHLAIGFDHLFLFFDDASDPAIDVARQYERVTVIPNDAKLRQRWLESQSYRNATLRMFQWTEVMARQLLNVDVAIQIALERGISWLLHIDSDELFYSPEQTVSEHFASLTHRGIRRATYLNHEAVPESPWITDPFREVTLFKQNRMGSGGAASRKKRAELADRVPQLPPKFFHFYSNGKSAARVRPGLTAPGVHGFRHVEESRRVMTTFTRFTRARLVVAASHAFPRFDAMLKERSLGMARAVIVTSPAILHYACCGFENFWDKYRILGQFDDKWWGQDDIKTQIGTFHIEARDIVAKADRSAALEFYEKRMVIRDEPEVANLISEGVFCRITEPSLLLEEIGRSAVDNPPRSRYQDLS